MNWDSIQGIVRAILAAGGGYAVGKGFVDQATMNEIIGAVLVIGSAIWSVLHNRSQAAAAKP